MQYQQNSSSNSWQFKVNKLLFFLLKNTMLRPVPDYIKEHVEQSFLYGCKTEELKFLHSKINGYILPAFMSEKDVKLCSTLKTRPGDVFLITYPKSGTVWLSEIVRYIAKPEGSGLLMDDTGPLFEIANHEKLKSSPSPRYLVTHLQPALVPYSKENGVKYIYLARNPRDVVVSYYYFMKQNHMKLSPMSFNFDGTWEEYVEYFMKGNLPYDSYFDHVLEWWSRKDDENVLFLKYEDLKKDLKGQVKIIAEFLGFRFSDQQAEAVAEKCTFQAMKTKPSNNIFFNMLKKKHMRKGIIGDWKNHFSDAQLEEFNQLYKSRMDGTGLEFEFEAR